MMKARVVRWRVGMMVFRWPLRLGGGWCGWVVMVSSFNRSGGVGGKLWLFFLMKYELGTVICTRHGAVLAMRFAVVETPFKHSVDAVWQVSFAAYFRSSGGLNWQINPIQRWTVRHHWPMAWCWAEWLADIKRGTCYAVHGCCVRRAVLPIDGACGVRCQIGLDGCDVWVKLSKWRRCWGFRWPVGKG